MTGGQTRMDLAPAACARRARAAWEQSPALRVVRATAEELARHEGPGWTSSIRAAGDVCVWRRDEADEGQG